QLGEARFFGGCAGLQLLVAPARDEELVPRGARGLPALSVFLADERVEHVELVRGPAQASLLELAGHRDQPVGCARDVLARGASPPRVRACSTVGEDAPGE